MFQSKAPVYIGAIDQGTSSSRFLIFDCKTLDVVTYHQCETKLIKPQAGWVEQDPLKMLSSVKECIDKATEKMRDMNLDPANIRALGLTNQQTTAMMWDKFTGQPFHNAIGKKIELGTAKAAPHGGLSSPVLSKIEFLIGRNLRRKRDGLFNIPRELLPQIRSSSEIYGYLVDTALKGLPIAAVIGDSKACFLGSMCHSAGQATHIFGTAGVLGCITGDKPVLSKHGCYTSVACKVGKNSLPYYALEAVYTGCGSGINWLKDNLGIISTASDIEELAGSVDDTHGCYVVPVLSGFATPYWDDDARATICGLSQFTNKAHIARAFLEGVCFHSRQMIECVEGDSGLTLSSMRVSGGMTVNNLLMQLLADITGIPIERPLMGENTALGAALLAGAAEGVGLWSLNGDDLPKLKYTTFLPRTSKEDRDRRYAQWIQAAERCRH